MPGRFPIVAVATAVLGTAVVATVAYRLLNPPVTLLEHIPAQVFARQPELATPYKNFVANGNKYIWGSNDCSIFVADYIASCGTPAPFRPTTLELMDPQFMRQVGFISDTRKVKTGDILVFRYQNAKNEWRGHTGVVVWHNDSHWVVHNTQSYNGVVMEALPQFLQKAQNLTHNKPGLLKTYRRKDFASWYAQFQKRRDES